MIFEFDPRKSISNKAKHGIDFLESQKLWNEQVIEGTAEFRGEVRSMITGTVNGKFWTVIVTHRKAVIRIISVRRARNNEIKQYERKFQPER